MSRDGHAFGYLTGTNGVYRVTSWSGGVLPHITRAWTSQSRTFGRRDTRWHFRGIAIDGSYWYGSGPGPGMYCLHRNTVQPMVSKSHTSPATWKDGAAEILYTYNGWTFAAWCKAGGFQEDRSNERIAWQWEAGMPPLVTGAFRAAGL